MHKRGASASDDVDKWRTDTHGPIKPLSFQRERFLQVYRDLQGKRYIYCYGMVTKHSSHSRANAEAFSRRVHRIPKAIQKDGGVEYKAEFERWELDNKILLQQVSARYDPVENGGAEVDIETTMIDALANMDIGAVPGPFWLEAAKYGCEVENLISGAWLEVHGRESYERALKMVMPFGSACSVVKEVPEMKLEKMQLDQPCQREEFQLEKDSYSRLEAV